MNLQILNLCFMESLHSLGIKKLNLGNLFGDVAETFSLKSPTLTHIALKKYS